jgi:hypothetical protein
VEQFIGNWLVRTLMLFIVIMAFQLYLAVSTELVDDALKQVERISSWPIQALNIGLFVLVLGICWLYLQSTRKDLKALQSANDTERREYIEALRTLVADTAKVVERNNAIYERIDRKLERLESKG